MNSDTHELLEGIAANAGAIVPCGICGNYDVSAWDEEADERAMAMTGAAFNRGEFGASARDEIMAAMRGVLSDANHECPSCGRDRD